MEKIIVNASVFLLLAFNSIMDLKKHEISLISLAIFGGIGIGLNLWFTYQSVWELAGGVGAGLFLLLVSFVTKEAVGAGDGLFLCVTGVFLGIWENLGMLAAGLLFCSVYAVGSRIVQKRRTVDRLPLVPFLLLAWIGGLIW